jgi:hypothetical protein
MLPPAAIDRPRRSRCLATVRTVDPRADRTPPHRLPDGRGLLHADRFGAALERWAAEARVSDAAERRARERWLARAAEEDATLTGVLIDLAERHVAVAIASCTGRRHQGAVSAIGDDFVALRTGAGDQVLIALSAVRSVRTAPQVGETWGDRATRAGVDLAGVLAGLAEEREQVLVLTADGNEAVAGEVRSVGRDVVVLRAGPGQGASAYVPLGAVAEVHPAP